MALKCKQTKVIIASSRGDRECAQLGHGSNCECGILGLTSVAGAEYAPSGLNVSFTADQNQTINVVIRDIDECAGTLNETTERGSAL